MSIIIIIIKDANYGSVVCFAMFACIGFHIRFPVLWLLYHSCLHLSSPLVFYSTSLLLLSYYAMCIPCLISLAISTCSCMPVLTTQFSMHIYGSDLSIHVCLSMHAIWHSHHHSLGTSDSPGSSCLGLRVWSLWILPVADQRRTAKVWIIDRPSEALSF